MSHAYNKSKKLRHRKRGKAKNRFQCLSTRRLFKWTPYQLAHEASLPSRAMTDDDLITVCDSCFQASCWQGIFYCDNYKEAGIVQKTRRELRELGYENESYWKTDEEIG